MYQPPLDPNDHNNVTKAMNVGQFNKFLELKAPNAIDKSINLNITLNM